MTPERDTCASDPVGITNPPLPSPLPLYKGQLEAEKRLPGAARAGVVDLSFAWHYGRCTVKLDALREPEFGR